MRSMELLFNFLVVLAFIVAALVQHRRKQRPGPTGEQDDDAPIGKAEGNTPAEEPEPDPDAPVVTRELATAVLRDVSRWGTLDAVAPQAPPRFRADRPVHLPAPARASTRWHGLPFKDRRALRQAIATMAVLGPCRALDPYGDPLQPRTNKDR